MIRNIFLFILLFMPFAALNTSAQQTAAPDNSVPPAPAAPAQNASSAPSAASAAPKINKDLPVIVEGKPKTAIFGRRFEVQVELPQEAKLDLANFDRKDFEIIKTTANQINPRKITLTVIPFNLGVLQFPQTTWLDTRGNKYYSDTFRIETKPVQAKVKTQGLADIRPPFRPFNPWYIALALAFAASAFALWRWYKLKKTALPAAVTPYTADNRPLHIIALEQIDNLLMEGLWEAGHYKLFYIRLTDILRDYFSARFALDAHRLTSRDLLKALKRCKEFKADTDPVNQFLKEADYVKFAKIIPSEEERDAHIQTLRGIIIETKQPAALQPSADDVLKTNVQLFDLPEARSEQEVKIGPEIEIIRSEKEFAQRLMEREQSPKDFLQSAPAAVSAKVKKNKAAQSAERKEDKKQNQKEDAKREMKELFLVSCQPSRPIDLKVKSALEKQGFKYAQMAEACFTQTPVFTKLQEQAEAKKEEEHITHRTLP